MDEFLFLKTKGERKYCYFQNDRQTDNSAFIVEFGMGADHYDQLYWWGRTEDRSVIKSFCALTYAPDNDWQNIDIANKCNIGNFDMIVEQALKEIEALKENAE